MWPLLCSALTIWIFVFGKHLGETLGSFHSRGRFRRDGLIRRRVFEELIGGVNVGAQAQLAGDLRGNRGVVARDHLDADAVLVRLANRFGGILARRIEQRQQAQELPGAGPVQTRHAERAETFAGKFIDFCVHRLCQVLRRMAHIENHLRRAFGHFEGLAVRALDFCLGAFVDRIEGNKFGLLKGFQCGGVFQSVEHGQVNRVAVFFLRGQRACQNQLLRVFRAKRSRFA